MNRDIKNNAAELTAAFCTSAGAGKGGYMKSAMRKIFALPIIVNPTCRCGAGGMVSVSRA